MKKRVLCIIAAVVFCLAVPVGALANSAEPPCVTVLVLAPPGDLELTIEFDSAQGEEPQRLSGERMLWEGYYRFHGRWNVDPEGLTGAKLVVETGDESFALPIDPTGFARYNNLITLDVGGRQLLYGQPWWRQPLLIFLRVSLTLVLEGLVFLIFGYRQKRSWLVFLLVNLVTQLGVNLCIYCVASPTALEPYAALIYLGLLLYTPMEILVLVAEAIAFSRLLKEHRKRRAVGYAFVANLFSWALGGALLAVLPL